jgi:hypothetical protein
MIDHEAIWFKHQRQRWMRPDAARFIRPDGYRWIRPDVARFLKPGTNPADVFPALALKYNPNQPRVPAGNPGGGQWTDGSQGVGLQEFSPAGVDDNEIVSPGDLPLAFQDDGTNAENAWQDLLNRLASNDPRPIPNAEPTDATDGLDEVAARRGGGGPVWFPGASSGQQTRLDLAIARSENAVTEIRRYEPDWQPREQILSAPGSVEGAIATAEARAAEAESRLDQLRFGVGGNFGPRLEPLPRDQLPPQRQLDGAAWIDAYRTINNAPDLFGRPQWPDNRDTVAVTKIDGHLYFGVNSSAPGYNSADENRAMTMRDVLFARYPELNRGNTGWIPNDALFHAESTILIRAANDRGDLANRSVEVQVDREVCHRCEIILPKIGLELGNPYVIFVELPTGIRNEMWNGQWLSGRFK